MCAHFALLLLLIPRTMESEPTTPDVFENEDILFSLALKCGHVAQFCLMMVSHTLRATAMRAMRHDCLRLITADRALYPRPSIEQRDKHLDQEFLVKGALADGYGPRFAFLCRRFDAFRMTNACEFLRDYLRPVVVCEPRLFGISRLLDGMSHVSLCALRHLDCAADAEMIIDALRLKRPEVRLTSGRDDVNWPYDLPRRATMAEIVLSSSIEVFRMHSNTDGTWECSKWVSVLVDEYENLATGFFDDAVDHLLHRLPTTARHGHVVMWIASLGSATWASNNNSINADALWHIIHMITGARGARYLLERVLVDCFAQWSDPNEAFVANRRAALCLFLENTGMLSRKRIGMHLVAPLLLRAGENLSLPAKCDYGVREDDAPHFLRACPCNKHVWRRLVERYCTSDDDSQAIISV